MSDKCDRCQIRWERDYAMEQLEEHHIPFGCVADDVVKVVLCKDCKSMQIYGGYEDEDDFNTWWCEELEREIIDPLWFCKDGERREE